MSFISGFAEFFKDKKTETPVPLQPKTEEQLLTERGNHQAHLDSVNAWSNESPHPADQGVINETTSKIETIDAELRRIQEAKLPTPPSTTPETQPIQPTAAPEVPQEQPVEQPKAA